MDEQAAQMQNLAAGCAQVNAEARNFTIEQCDSLKSELITELRRMRVEGEVAEQYCPFREELAELRMTATTDQQPWKAGRRAGGEELPWVFILSRWRRGSIESEPADVRAWCGATQEPAHLRSLSAAIQPQVADTCSRSDSPRSPPCGTARRKPAKFDGRVAW